MPNPLRIATFNLENLDETASEPTLDKRIAVMRPQLNRIRADVLCLQEVHGQGARETRSLTALDHLIAGTRYASFNRAVTTLKSDPSIPYDQRNLVILSRFPILSVENVRHDPDKAPRYRQVTASPPDTEASVIEWERPILYVQLDLGPQVGVLHLMTAHLKSKLPTTISGQKINNFTWRSIGAWAEGSFISAMKRVGQALQMRCKIDEIFDAYGDEALVVVTGDLNATADEVPVQALLGPVEETGNPDLVGRTLIACANSVAESSRFSLLHLGHGEMIDHVLMSRGMLPFYSGTEIHNEALPDESGAFRTDAKFPESDHAPVIAEFLLPDGS